MKAQPDSCYESKKESNIKSYVNMKEDEYIKLRIDDQIKWYSDKAIKNKCLNYLTKSTIIVFSATIPLIAGLDFDNSAKNIILGLLGILIAIISGIFGLLLKFNEKWTEYRITSETFKHEIFFQTKTGSYCKETEPLTLLVTRIKNVISKEHSTWNQYINEQK